jgi:hypothetical protein
MKNIIICLSLFVLSLGHLQAQNDTNPNWLIFTDELENFVDGAQLLYDEGMILPTQATEQKIGEMIEIGYRVANIYFVELESDIRPRLEKYLNKILTDNEHLRNYFVLLGNSFIARAKMMLEDQQEKNSRIRKWSTIGGTVLGLATGTAILYFKQDAINGVLKSAMLVIGLGAAGAAVGYGGGYVATTFVLPAEEGIDNATDFMERYPGGEDFISDIEDVTQDIAIKLNELEGDS